VIRHRPTGRGHAYQLEPDQRVPAWPVSDEPLELRVTVGPDDPPPTVELETDGQRSVLGMEPLAHGTTAPGVVDGHLAAAATAMAGRRRRAWRAVLRPMAAGTRLRYRFASATGGGLTRWFSVTVAGWRAESGRLAVEGDNARLLPDSAAWLVADSGPMRARFALKLEPGSRVIGFGERFDRLDQAGERLDAVVFEQYRAQGKRTYLPIPFAIVIPPGGADGWGFHVRTTARTWYDVGATASDRIQIEVALDPSDPDPRVELAIYRGSPREVLAAFLDEVGPPVLPPDWIFRPWMSGNEWSTDARVRAEVERSLAEGIPAGVMVIEAWSDESTFTIFRDAGYTVNPDGAPHRLADFTFPVDGAWPDPKGLADWLHARDIRLVLWQIPLAKARQPSGSQARADTETMIERGYAVREADGRAYRNRGWWFPGALLPDWTNPDARAWWLAKRRYLLEEVGVDGFKTDGGEHAWGDDLRYADGSRGVVTNNTYPVRYAAAYHELLAQSGSAGITFSRAGFTGAASVPAHWAGDERSTWEAFRASIVAGLSAGVSGVLFWGWDFAGFSGEVPDAELYLRAAAMAALCPIMQYHSEFNHHRSPSRDRTPWNIAERAGDPRVIPLFRGFATLRERLVPYLAAEARHSVKARIPMMRALCFEWPGDATLWSHPYQYMLGDSLLVAPVVEPGVEQWPVYLPPGQWTDAWTGEQVVGGSVITPPVPLERIPVYVRGADPLLAGVFRT
jgi:alpha-glucosidase (family GH31 glycosyl hydrolase)